jgi:hypothetical protein
MEKPDKIEEKPPEKIEEKKEEIKDPEAPKEVLPKNNKKEKSENLKIKKLIL